MRISFVGIQSETERHFLLAQRAGWLIRRRRLPRFHVALQGPLIDREVHVHRVDRHNRRQQRIAAAGIHQVALGEHGRG